MANFSPEICQDLGFTSTSVTDEVPVPDDTLIFSHLDASIVLHHGNAKVKKTVGLSKEHGYSKTPNIRRSTASVSANDEIEEHAYSRPKPPSCRELFQESVLDSFVENIRTNDKKQTEPDDIRVSDVFIMQRARSLINQEVKNVSTKRMGEQSLLLTRKKMEHLSEDSSKLCDSIIEEMKNRTPFLLEIMLSAFDEKHLQGQKSRITGSLAIVYSILMFARNAEMSAFQRMMTAICIRGRAEDMLITRLNRVGVTLSPTSKQRLIKEAGEISHKALCDYLKEKPLLKITGDNLDIYIKSRCVSIDKGNTDLHLFASNALTSRLSSVDMDNRTPLVPEVNRDVLKLTEAEIDNMKYSYSILIARILSTLDQFKWMSTVVPVHINHGYSAGMSQKSQVFQLPIQHKNEAKYEDILDIMDSYEKLLQKTFQESHGTVEMLDEFGVIASGDQLTKVRFEGAKKLRLMSPTTSGRLDHLRPVVIELWHLKQDYLEKTFKALYKMDSIDKLGTLAFWRNRLKKTDVNGKVKGHFNSHSEFFKLIVRELIREQAFELFNINIENTTAYPQNISKASRLTKENKMMELSGEILHKFDVMRTGVPSESNDELFNYSTNLTIRGLHYLQMEDTVKEGDISRIIPNLKVCIPIFYAHSCLSKYLFECVDYITKVTCFLSPLEKLRVLEGSMVNLRGGQGNNIEADLVQEHSVRNQKELIRGLGANKTETAISAVTAAAPVISQICRNFDAEHNIAKKASRHSKIISTEDIKVVRESLRKMRPFSNTNDRKCSFPNLPCQPSANVDRIKMDIDLNVMLGRVGRGYISVVNEEDADIGTDDEEDDDEIPDIPL
ncbi:uncharacterized protein LOC143051506 [Mytilus galloprovincialis]|uniref:uncharacterized protein LOC143051506 n=1 Tax=Mytilus galloprovincialis TaxID=29158 RepID=UPI003F7BFAD4